MSAGTGIAIALVVVAGLAGAMQVAVMGEIGERVGIVPALAFATGVGMAAALGVLLVVERSFVGLKAAAREPLWLWTGGLMSVLIVLAVTVAGPRIGTAATIGVVIAGNLAMAAVIDRFGLLGQEQIALSWPRLVGLALLAVGSALSLTRA